MDLTAVVMTMQKLAGQTVFEGVFEIVTGIFVLSLGIVYIISLWKLFTKAGQPGWAAIIPIYNMIVILKIAGRPVWWIFLLLIPLVDIFVLAVVSLDIARNFGKGVIFGIGLFLLPEIFYPILAWGSARYHRSIVLTNRS